MYTKTIEWGHQNLRSRKPREGEEDQLNKSEVRRQKEIQRRNENRYKVHDRIQIWSNSNQQWCFGEVLSVETDGPSGEGQMVNCAYVTPGGVDMTKKIAMGH